MGNLVQERRNSSVLAMDLSLASTKPPNDKDVFGEYEIFYLLSDKKPYHKIS